MAHANETTVGGRVNTPVDLIACRAVTTARGTPQCAVPVHTVSGAAAHAARSRWLAVETAP